MLANEAGALILQTLEQLEAGTAKPAKQNSDGITYAKKITKEECFIDWHKPAQDIANIIRGLSPSPATSFLFQNEKIKVFTAHPNNTPLGNYKSGEVISNFLEIACENGKSTITLEELQRPGKSRMGAVDFLKGFNIPQGSILE
jgi:methionyl-tRNA formyltransferase